MYRRIDEAELLTPAEMSEADRLTIEGGTPEFDLMQAAGRAVAAEARRMAAEGRVLVLAGPGNNGGDGFVAAEALRRQGREVRVVLLGDATKLRGSAAEAARAWKGPTEQWRAEADMSAALIVDALFGAGLARDLDGDALTAVQSINASGRPVLSVDLPSGIDGRTGEVRGEAILAARTITFFRLKPGHLLLPGRLHCGETELAQIGIPDSVLGRIGPRTFHNLPGLWLKHLGGPAMSAHKYQRGHVVVVSGHASSTGAARLAAAAAARIGAGAVTVASPSDALLVNAAQLTSVMVAACDSPLTLSELLSRRNPTAAIIGPGNGIGPETAENVLAALAGEAALVLDADALTSFQDNRKRLIHAVKSRSQPVVMTPHSGEFERLFETAGSKLDRARAAAVESGAVVVLKGPDTVIAAPDGWAAVNSNAPPHLATAGSGDVLAGIIAGLLAQKIKPFQASAAGVWLHGAAGAALGWGLIADDLPNALPAILQELDGDAADAGF